MDFNEIASIRGMERLLIVGGAIFSLWIAYRIYSETQENLGETLFRTEKITVELKKLGPSVFFGLFGTTVLIVALLWGYQETTSNKQQQSGEISAVDAQESYVRYLNSKENIDLTADLRNLRLNLRKISTHQSMLRTTEAPFTPAERIILSDLIKELDNYEEILVDSAFGAGTFGRYQDVEISCGATPAECDVERRSFDEDRGEGLFVKISEFLEPLPE